MAIFILAVRCMPIDPIPEWLVTKYPRLQCVISQIYHAVDRGITFHTELWRLNRSLENVCVRALTNRECTYGGTSACPNECATGRKITAPSTAIRPFAKNCAKFHLVPYSAVQELIMSLDVRTVFRVFRATSRHNSYSWQRQASRKM